MSHQEQVLKWQRQVEILKSGMYSIEDGFVVKKPMRAYKPKYKAVDLPCPPDPRDYDYVSMFAGTDPLPPKVMWKDHMGPLWNQLDFGTCTSCLVDLLDFFALKNGDYPRVDGEKIDSTGNDIEGLSHAFLYHEEKKIDGIPDQEGSYNRTGCKVAKDVGCCPEYMLPYSKISRASDGRIHIPTPTEKMYEAAKPYRVKAYARIDYPDQGVEGAKRAIAEQGPLYIGILVCENFMDLDTDIIKPPGGWILGGHAVLLVGYDDKKQAFLMRNSWGPEWGMEGYKWMPYELWDWRTNDDMFAFLLSAWTLVDPDWRGGQHFTPPELGAAYQVGTDKKWVNGAEGKCHDKTLLFNDRVRLLLRDVGEDLNAILEKADAPLGIEIDWLNEQKIAVLRGYKK